MLNFFFPWRRKAEELQSELANATLTIEVLDRELQMHRAQRKEAIIMLAAQRATIKGGHFRDPKTGRIGPKGKVYGPLSKDI